MAQSTSLFPSLSTYCNQDLEFLTECGEDLCCPGILDHGAGLVMPFFGEAEQCWSTGLRAALYFIGMIWCFLGVAIVADLFMGAIDQIVSSTYIKIDKAGKKQVYKRWNPTVANLSLMALGSSAPEILLNVLEIVGGEFYAGALGPSTIVGSASFNLLVITAVCVFAVGDGVKTIKDLKVYSITGVTSVLAYIWLYIILLVWSPDVITIEEGIITFAFFWILLFAAYAASKNFFRAAPVAPDVTSSTNASSNIHHRGEMDEMTVKNTLKMANKMDGLDHMDDAERVNVILESMKPVTVATHTRNAMSWLTGKKARPIYDEHTGTIHYGAGGQLKHTLSESAKHLVHGSHDIKRKDGDAPAAGKRMSKGADSPAKDAGSKVATISFKEEAVDVMEDAGFVHLVVVRRGALSQEVSVGYASSDISATAGKDYTAVEGTLVFEADQKEAEIKVPVIDDDRFEKSETFRVALKDPSANAELDEGGSLAMVTICNDDELKKKSLKVLEHLGNRDKFEVAAAQWKQQFKDAIRPGAEDDEKAGPAQWAIHILTIVFKVSFALVPPTNLGGGWPAFIVSLGFIALMTVLVGDLAGFFGCVVGLPPAITAITFVALGTSMPDTFASKAAAQAEPTADNSVGNVTGSNCVNVFLGLGLPWTIGAAYWMAVTPDSDAYAAWAAEYADVATAQEYIANGKAVFVVRSGDLGLSVIVFTVCAIICLGWLAVKRKMNGGELGGSFPMRTFTVLFFCLLWVTYVLVSSFQRLPLESPIISVSLSG